MENKFKWYYDYILEKKRAEVYKKHDDHGNFCEKVDQIRELIKFGDQSWKQDKDFLEKLLHRQDNEIVNLPYLHKNFSYNKFQKLIINDSFMFALGEFIVSPSQDTHTKFDEAWVEQQKFITGLEYNVAVINRVAPVCTLAVSTAVISREFDCLFNWLIEQRMIPKYPSDENQGWFTKNQFLMKEIHQQFQNELESGETDEVYLSDFIWYLHDCTKNLPSRRKIL